ncbi:MAG: hypothetical protein ACI4MC_05915 [Candidatus Coproplasma sp.]
MKASNLDLMRIAAAFDGEFSLSDFSLEELDALAGYITDDDTAEDIKRKYFEFYDDIKDRVLDTHKWSD